jgi:hypothetical protein
MEDAIGHRPAWPGIGASHIELAGSFENDDIDSDDSDR